MKRLWRDGDFLKLWLGQAVSQAGSRISREGLPWTAVQWLGASPLQMGLLNGVTGAAVLLPGLFAGAWVDRLRRRPVLIGADLARAALLAWIPYAAWTHRLTIAQLFWIGPAVAALSLLFDIAYQTYLPALVEREALVEGNAKLALTESAAEVAGPGLAGLLIQWLTAPIAILFDAASFLISALSLSAIRRAETPPEPHMHPHIGREIAEGLRQSWKDPILRALAASSATAALFLGFPNGLYILYAVRELGLNPASLGLIITVGGVTSLVGALAVEPMVRRLGVGRTLLGAGMLGAAIGFAVPLARGPYAALWMIAAQVGDFTWPLYMVNETSLRQAVTPPRLLGRVNSANQLLFRGLLAAGGVGAGMAAQRVGIRPALFIGAAGFLLSNLWLIFSPIPRLRAIPKGTFGLQSSES